MSAIDPGEDGGRMRRIGLAIAERGVDDHFVAALVHALAEPLIDEGMGLVTRVVPSAAAELDLYRHWAGTSSIAGVALLGAGRGDTRIDVLEALGLPFAAVVGHEQADDHPSVVIDVAASVAVLSDFLEGRRHERAVYLVGPTESVTAKARAAAIGDRFEVVRTGRSSEEAVAAARRVVSESPATLLFDSDVHAAAASSEFLRQGLAIPDDVAIVSWTDSALCRTSSPSITAVDRRGGDIGDLLGRRILATIAGEPARSDRAPAPFIVRRESA